MVYIGSTDFYLYALDAASGQEKWRFNTGGIVYSCPVFFNNKLYQLGGGASSLFILDAVTGKSLLVKELGFNGAGTLATPVISRNGNMAGIYSSESGAVNWQVKVTNLTILFLFNSHRLTISKKARFMKQCPSLLNLYLLPSKLDTDTPLRGLGETTDQSLKSYASWEHIWIWRPVPSPGLQQ